MKKLLLPALFCLFAIGNVAAQNWFQSDYRFTYHISGGFAGFNFYQEMYFHSDTIIKGRPSKRWDFNTTQFSLFPTRYTYTDGSRAYAFNTQLDSFVLLYDFSLPVGSRVQVPGDFGLFTYEIDSIDTVFADPFTLKRQRAHYVTDNGQATNWQFDILENAGMVGRPFESNVPECGFVLLGDPICGSAVDGIDIKFVCFSTNTGVFRPFPLEGPCALTSTDDPPNALFQLSPNPAVDGFRLQGQQPDAPQFIRLYDVRGQLQREWRGEVAQCSLAGLPAALYYVEAVFPNGLRGVKKLIKAAN
jgi:hypothetical protein